MDPWFSKTMMLLQTPTPQSTVERCNVTIENCILKLERLRVFSSQVQRVHRVDSFILGLDFKLTQTKGVTNPFFAGSGSGSGTTTKGVGLRVAWIRIFAGIGSTHGIGSFFGLHISNINSGGPISVISCKVS